MTIKSEEDAKKHKIMMCQFICLANSCMVCSDSLLHTDFCDGIKCKQKPSGAQAFESINKWRDVFGEKTRECLCIQTVEHKSLGKKKGGKKANQQVIWNAGRYIY